MRPTFTTQLVSESCSILVERRTPTVLLLRIAGHDVGEFGALPMRCIEAFMPPELPVELFVDARDTRGATIDVSNDWASWLGQHRSRFSGIRMLTANRFVTFTAEFVRRFSELESVMQLYSDASEFDDILSGSAPVP
jgi:hypothetical protein